METRTGVDFRTLKIRIIEHKHFEMFGVEVDNCPNTVILREYSTEWKDDMEPYYPVNDASNIPCMPNIRN